MPELQNQSSRIWEPQLPSPCAATTEACAAQSQCSAREANATGESPPFTATREKPMEQGDPAKNKQTSIIIKENTQSGKIISKKQRIRIDACQVLEPRCQAPPWAFWGREGLGRPVVGDFWRKLESHSGSRPSRSLLSAAEMSPLFLRLVPRFPYAHSAPADLSQECCLPFSAEFTLTCLSPPSQAHSQMP